MLTVFPRQKTYLNLKFMIIISKRFDILYKRGVILGITIKDIAKLAGVSTSTVSLVLSKKGYVSETTQTKVQKVIDEYNYRPLRAARQLASHLTGYIGFIISHVHLSRSEAFYTRILLGSELEARNYDASIILSTVGLDFSIPNEVPRFLKEKAVDGIIIAGSVREDLIQYIYQEGIPVVLIDFRINDLHLDNVFIDNRSGVRQAVEHLIQKNVERIGFVGGSFYHPSIQERFEGYQLAMEKGGLGDIARDKAFHFLENSETTAEIGEKGMAQVLTNVPDLEAVICVNDTTAMGCLQHLRKKKLHVPSDLAVIGFDDVNIAAVAHPPLTTIHVPKIEMGVTAIRLLIDRIAHPSQVHQTRLVPVELVIRESSLKNQNGQ